MKGKKRMKRLLACTMASAFFLTEAAGAGGMAGTSVQVQAAETEEVVHEWNFDEGIGGWEYAEGWNYQYEGTPAATASENGMLKVDVDFSQDGSTSWSQTGVREWGDVSLQGVTKTTFDFYFDESKLNGGTFGIKEDIQYQNDDQYPSALNGGVDVAVDTENAVNAEELSGYKKVTVEVPFDPIAPETCCNVVLLIIGKNTTYSGSIYIDNIKMLREVTEDIYVDAAVTASDDKELSISGGNLISYGEDGSAKTTAIASDIKMVDAQADANTKALYAYLKAVGESDSMIFGHQNDIWHKAGSASVSTSKFAKSDTEDVTGSIAGVVGIDTLSLVGNEFSAERYNKEFKAEGESDIPGTAAGNVEAAAKLTNLCIAEGAIITLSAHMPNFSIVQETVGGTTGQPSYAKYNFSGYSPNNTDGDVINEILPGGAYNEVFTAYLDMIADYAMQVNGSILFRPFHENTGSWFWWGKAFCDAATYKNVYRYTVDYLKSKNVHNIIYVYGPGSEAASVEEYGERYPGDDYVDMVGFDMYNIDPRADGTWFDDFAKELQIVDDFATAHGKLIAVTETGAATSTADKGDNQTALHKNGNDDKDWYNKMLNAAAGSNASYYLLWANFGVRDGFYTPYVASVKGDGTLHGHEMLDNFINFYNDARSIFASNQKEVLSTLVQNVTPNVLSTTTEAVGYFLSPVSGKRILEPMTVKAQVSNIAQGEDVTVVLVNGDKKVEISAAAVGSTYTAEITQNNLDAIGEGVGRMQLCLASGKILDEINATYNIPEPEIDPYEVDGFENYYGVDEQLNKAWATNKNTGDTISLTLTSEPGTFKDGNYGLKFTYDEGVGGWAGATISKPVDWTDCNAMRLWTIPDGKNQKVVVQITAGGYEYESYLNEREDYKDKTEAMTITIPFEEFVDRDGDGPAGGLVELRSQIQSVGLWVNQIGSSRVNGTIYYDSITAVNTNASEPDDEQKPGTGGIPVLPGVPNSGTDNGSNSGTNDEQKPGTDEQKPGTDEENPGTDNEQRPSDEQIQIPTKGTKATVGGLQYQVTKSAEKNGTVAFTAPKNTKITKLTIPATVKIDGVTFKVAEISKNAFKDCRKLEKVRISNNVTKINSGAFQNCSALTAVRLGTNVKSIGKNTFKGCSKLKVITIESKKLSTVGDSAFKGIHKKAVIKVPSSELAAYKKLLKGKGQSSTVTIRKI